MEGPVRFRTNVGLLAVSVVLTLTGALLNIYGGYRIVGDVAILKTAIWPAAIIAFGVGGVALYLIKGMRTMRRLRWALGAVSLAPIILAAIVGAYSRNGMIVAVFLPALFAAAYALYVDEPRRDEATHGLLPLFSGTVLVLTGALYFLLPPSRGFPFFDVIAYAAMPVGAAGFLFHAYFPGSKRDHVGQVLMAAVFLAIAAVSLIDSRPLYAALYGPFAVLLLAFPLFKYFTLGAPLDKGLSEENLVVHQFEGIAKLTAWSVYVFTYVHIYYRPVELRSTLFALFVAAFVIFTVEYDAISPKRSTYRKYMLQSHVNSVLLGVVLEDHFLGRVLVLLPGLFGLRGQSPYLWFYTLILVSGSIETNTGHILLRLAVASGYFAFETVYTYVIGALNTAVIIDYLFLVYIVTLLVGIYAYRLSAKRKEVDESLHRTNQKLKEALDAAERARELATARGREIEIAKKRDEAIMASLGDGIIALDRNGGIVMLNPAAEGVTGKSLPETRGKRIPDLFAFRQEGEPVMKIDDYLNSALNGNAIALPENMYLETRTGGRAYLAGALVPIFDEARSVVGVVMTFRDVTYLREVDEMKNSFLSVAAHQLRTPLSTIRWFLELLNDPEEGKLKKNQKMFAESAYQSLRNMVELVNRLLAVTRLEGGRVPVRPVPVDLKKMIDGIVDGLAVKLKDRRLGIHFKADETLPSVALDESLAREVFANLIENAVRYTPDGGVVIIAAAVEGEAIHWSIKDSGIGIPKEQQAKIFEKFYRADNAVAHTAEGTGLGLYLAKFIVDAWGGKIWFESEPGQGATFHVTIPRKGMRPKEGQVSLNA